MAATLLEATSKVFALACCLATLSALLVIAPKNSPRHKYDYVEQALSRYVGNLGLADNFLDNLDVTVTRGFAGRVINGVPDKLSPSATRPALHYRPAVDSIIEMLVSNTRFEGKFQINLPPKADHLNIYVVRDDPMHLSTSFTGNCSFIGFANAIVCDASFLRDEMAKFEQISELYEIAFWTEGEYNGAVEKANANELWLAAARKLLRTTFLTWILGHEIGHATLHQDVVLSDKLHINFDANLVDSRELEADLYVVSRLPRDDSYAAGFLVGLAEYIEQQLRSIVKERNVKIRLIHLGDERFISQRYAIQIPYSSFERPLLARALQVAHAFASAPNSPDTTGHFSRAMSNISFISERQNEKVKLLAMSSFALLVVSFFLIVKFIR